LIVRARQPLSPLVKATLEFDPRYDKASLERERKELERKQRSKAYDVTAWSPTHAYDLDGYWCADAEVKATRVTALPPAGADRRARRCQGSRCTAGSSTAWTTAPCASPPRRWSSVCS
jgi:hypothetical protein